VRGRRRARRGEHQRERRERAEECARESALPDAVGNPVVERLDVKKRLVRVGLSDDRRGGVRQTRRIARGPDDIVRTIRRDLAVRPIDIDPGPPSSS
jgi:hypothetical protein